jgi:hypothetical protein
MKNLFFLLLLFISTAVSFAQKNMIPLTRSELTGIELPAGSKRDKRMLSVSSARMLLELESKKTERTVSTTEVLVIPLEGNGGFNKVLLDKELINQGFVVTVSANDKEYSFLQKGTQCIIMYFAVSARESNLYFGITTSIPVQNQQVNIKSSQQIVSTGNNQTPPTSNTIIQNNLTEIPKPPAESGQTKTRKGFVFTTTNFDDGWVATEQADWVLVTKGTTRVLIHYPNKQADEYNSVLLDGLRNAWNILVAPKYSSVENLEFKPYSGWESIEFAEADMVEKTSGKLVHVVLFKKNYNSGGGKYIEFITPDKKSFELEFGTYRESSTGWEKMESMALYNKFAVAVSDLTGKWTSDFSGAIQYVNAYTGFDAGMNTHASAENFQFETGSTYKWDLAVANGMVGNIKFQSVKSSGTYSLPTNWQMKFSDIEGKPCTYNVYFSCIKGLRILWLQDAAYGDYKSYAKVE